MKKIMPGSRSTNTANYTVPERKNRSRVFFTGIIFIIVYSLIAVRLYNIQIRSHNKYTELYKNQSRNKISIYAPKGNIYDRKYNVLAENIGLNYYFGINTKVVENKNDLAQRISQITGKEKERYHNKLRSKNGFIWVTEGLSEKERIELHSVLNHKELSAASFKATPNRTYPQGRTAGQIIGYTDIDGNGRSGIEKEFASKLNGIDGWEYIYRDGKSKMSYGKEKIKKDPVPGTSVVLTIDDGYQAIVEDELKKAVEKWEAQKGVVIVMEPHTGEILAMSSYPDYDPNDPGQFDASERKNKAITDTYEPGSTFKGLTAAMLIEERLVSESDSFFCDNDGIKFGRRVISDSHENEEEEMTFTQVIAQSSNVGTVKAVEGLDKGKHYEYLRDFGFGNKTDIELTGEVNGYLLKSRKWSITTQPTLSFGQGISVTPLQLITSYTPIANGGDLVKPMIVKGLISHDNKVVEKFERKTVRKVISRDTAFRIRRILRAVVVEGTGSNAEIEGMKVAGKTGTSQKVIDGRYSKRKYDASFIGMVPYDDPKLLCLVMIDSPKGSIYGSAVCAPAFKNIIERIYNDTRSKLLVKGDDRDRYKEVPNVTGIDFETAEMILALKGINYKTVDASGKVRFQSVPPYSLITEGEEVVISGTDMINEDKTGEELIPSVKGMPLRKALRAVHSFGISAYISGRGNVVRQVLKYNAEGKVEACSLYCKPLKEYNDPKIAEK